MKKTLLPLLCAATAMAAFASTSFAGYKGSVSYTEEERAEHRAGIQTIMKAASQCLQDDLARHQEFIRRFGVSAFYGDNSSFAKKSVQNPDGTLTKVATTDEDKRNILRRYNVPERVVQGMIPRKECNGIEDCPLLMQPTSCIGLTLKCLGKGFEAAHQEHLWERARDFSLQNGAQGDALQVALQQLGWKIVYWNPDVSSARDWDLDEQEMYPGDPKHIWGQHEETWRTVSTRQRYYLNTVDDYRSMINFGAGVPKRIKNVPFFVGIAHLGYHVFPGSFGQIIEGHSVRLVNDPQTIETSPFAPLSPNGGPRGGPYKSGLVAIPPGY